MRNSVLASIEFSFKGVVHEAIAFIDLDLCLRHGEPMHYIYHTIAAENGIGSHTYEFDVMLMEPVAFSQAKGLATRFLHDGKLDFEGLKAAWQAEKIDAILQPIALKYLSIDKLDEHPDIKGALIEAYLAN